MAPDEDGRDDSPDGVPISEGTTVLLRSGDGTSPTTFVGNWRSGQPNLLGVTVDRSIQLFLADWRSSVERTPGDVALVGVGETIRSTTSGAVNDCRSAGDRIYTVADPTDLDAVERHVRALLDDWRTSAEPTVVLVDSVAGLLDVAPERDVIRFVADLTDLVDTRGAIGFLTACGSADVPELLERACDDAIKTTPDGWRPVEPNADRGGQLPVGDAFGLLADGRRRRILRFLDGRDRATVENIADAIADGTDLDERIRLAGSLVHVHLPKLHDSGVVVYDPGAGVVRPTAAVERLLSIADLLVAGE